MKKKKRTENQAQQFGDCRRGWGVEWVEVEKGRGGINGNG